MRSLSVLRGRQAHRLRIPVPAAPMKAEAGRRSSRNLLPTGQEGPTSHTKTACVMNTDPPILNSVTSSDNSSRAIYLYNPQGSQEKIMVSAEFWKTRHVARGSTAFTVISA